MLQIRFWYNIVGGTSKILVYKRINYYKDGMKFLGDLDTDIADYWQRAEVEVRNDAESQPDFQVCFFIYWITANPFVLK